MAKVTVFSTKGKKRFVVETEANTWGELKEALAAEDVEVKNMKAIVGETQTTLESSAAVLPKGLTQAGEVTKDFTLFLTPVKVKSGCSVDVESMSYKECKEYIKVAFITEPEAAKEHFGNYTIMGTSQMRALIQTWVEFEDHSSTDEVTALELIDATVANLQVLRIKVAEGTVAPEKVVDEIQLLDDWYTEIAANM